MNKSETNRTSFMYFLRMYFYINFPFNLKVTNEIIFHIVKYAPVIQ